MWASLKADVALMRSRRADQYLPYLFPQLFAVAAHRVAHALGTSGLAPLARLVQIVALTLTGAELDWRAEIGPGLFLEDPQGVEIGDNVEIWAKASVLGPVHVGDRATIGAHALVMHDVPAGAVARGVPAQMYIDGELVPRQGASIG